MCCEEITSVGASSSGHARYFSEDESQRITALMMSKGRNAERDAELARLLESGGVIMAPTQRPQRTICGSCCTLAAVAICRVEEFVDGKWVVVEWTTRGCSLYERLIVCTRRLFGSIWPA